MKPSRFLFPEIAVDASATSLMQRSTA